MSSDRASASWRRWPRIGLLASPVVVIVLAATSVVALPGCGKPGYCSSRSDLEQSIKGVADVNVLQSGGLQQLRTQLQKVESDARKLVDSAKSDFPSQSQALQSSVSKLKSDLEALPSSPTPQQLAAVLPDGQALVKAFRDFKAATDSKCS